nr:MAG TPA: LONG TAIL FIBER PROTEIN [Caudoviricetes sp.]
MASSMLITSAGLREVVNAEHDGTAPIKLTQIAFGTGKYVPSAERTSLEAEFKRFDAISGGAVGDNVLHVSARDASSETYVVYEIGLFTESGTLFAVCSDEMPLIQKSARSQALLSIDMAVVGFSAESIVLGDTNFLNPPATTTTAGVVYLASDSDIEEGTSISKVVTAKALKNALDSIEFQATIQDVDLNSCKTPGVYHCKGQIQNIPPGYEQGTLFVTRNADGMVLQQYWTQTRKMWMRQLEGSGATEWKRYGNNFTASTTDLTAGSSPLENGCFYFVYE